MLALPCSGVHRLCSSSNLSSKPPLAGILILQNRQGRVLGRKKIFANKEILIGRDKSTCQYVLSDAYVSKRHVRIYTVVYEDDEPNEVETLVYAEDLSQNGTYLNADFIGKGNGGFLLSDGDLIRLSRRTSFIFRVVNKKEPKEAFDFIQEKEMAGFRKDYTVTDRLLGAGAFGKVFMAIEETSRAQVACKVVDLRRLTPNLRNQFSRAEQPAAAEDVDSKIQARKVKSWVNQKKREQGVEAKLKMYFREIEILSSISHPNIVGLEKVYITNNTIYMMQEIVTAGDLFSYIESKNGKLLEVEAAVIIRQILVAVRFLHQNHIVHRDIKPDNILMTSLAAGCRVVLTDFGTARRIQTRRHRMSTLVGTHEYAAPEMLRRTNHKSLLEKSDGYTQAVDMWAVGCVAVILLTGGMAFSDPVTGMYSERLARDCNLDFLRESKDWQAVRQRPREFVERLLVVDARSRLTAEEALQHPWFSNDTHKNDFEELYQRTIKHWRPRHHKSPMTEFKDDGTLKYLAYKWGFEAFYHKGPKISKSSKRGLKPVEPPYKPFPKKMHRMIWPRQIDNEKFLDELLKAIRKWPAASTTSLACKAVYPAAEEAQAFIAQDTLTLQGSKNGKPPTALSISPSSESTHAARDLSSLGGKERSKGGSRQGVRSDLGPDRPLIREFQTRIIKEPHESTMPSSGHDSKNWRNLPQSSLIEQEAMVPRTEAQNTAHKLKRRASTELAGQRWTKRRGSIFDLAEDGDWQDSRTQRKQDWFN